MPAVGERVTVGIRPEGFGETAHGGEWTLNATVAVIESLGRETMLYVDAGDLRAYDSESQEGLFAVQRSRQIVAAPGDPVAFSISRDAVYVFDRDGRALRHVAAGNAN
jgi:multiple sugar transport system ATP-binding protein